jgi:hypothetical protein
MCITVSSILGDRFNPIAAAQVLAVATSVANSVTCANARKVTYCFTKYSNDDACFHPE